LADPVIDGRIILRWIFSKWDRLQALVNAVMNLLVL